MWYRLYNIKCTRIGFGSYLQVNPQLCTPVPQINLVEIERISITRFRTGSHNLLLETGRYSYPKDIARASNLFMW